MRRIEIQGERPLALIKSELEQLFGKWPKEVDRMLWASRNPPKSPNPFRHHSSTRLSSIKRRSVVMFTRFECEQCGLAAFRFPPRGRCPHEALFKKLVKMRYRGKSNCLRHSLNRLVLVE